MACRFWGFIAFFNFFIFVPLARADEVLRFGESPIGYVTVSPANVREEILWPELKPSFCRRAVGEVSVPGDGLLGIELVGSNIVDARDLQCLPPQISSLEVSDAVLTNEHMAELAKLTALTRITFSRCKFSDDAFDSLGHFSELKSCTVMIDSFSDSFEQSFVSWACQQTKLEQLFFIPLVSSSDNSELSKLPKLTSSAISEFSKLPNLKAIHATLGADATKTLNALTQLRSLEYLNAVVRDDCPPDALDKVGELDQLRSYRQFRGRVSSIALTKFGEAGRLEHLDLALVDIEPDSLNAIAKIKTLKELKILTRDQKHDQLRDLPKVCRELPRLTSWPRFENLSRDDLTLILSRPDTERLSFRYLDPTLKARDLEELAKLRNLRVLKIEGIAVDDDWLKKISTLSKLETLDLFDTRIVGHGFGAFAGHKNFRELFIFVGPYEDAPAVILDLNTLAGTNIESLRISGNFCGESLQGIGEIKSLRELRLFGDLLGFSDDSNTKDLSRLPDLRILHMTGNCFITDVGADELSKVDTLQSLMVSGFVTEKGVAKLSKIPSLNQLIVCSSKVDSEFKQDIPQTTVRTFNGNVDEQGISNSDDLDMGADGFLRKSKAKELERIRQLEGNQPPSITVTDFGRGETFKLEDYRGKVVLIDFWGTWCGPCRIQMPKLHALYKKYHSSGLEIVSIHTSSGSEDLAAYLEKKELPWIHLVDKEDSTVTSFCVPHYPSLFLVDRSGKLRVALAHPDGIEGSVKKLLSEGQ